MYREHVNDRIQERANELIALMKKEVEVAESVHGQVPIDDLDYWDLLAYKCANMLWGGPGSRSTSTRD
jgi:hypothetical protein